jgi:hypothetical protein
MGGMLSGLTAVSQMLPASNAARKLTELYAHFQRHLARSRDYFLEQSVRVQVARAAAKKEEEEKKRSEDAAKGIISPLTPPRGHGHVLARVDSEGFVGGPPRSAPTLAPATLFSSSESKLSGRDGARRRGGGHLGMLETQTPEEMAESIRVLADMVAKDSLENEQALRVLNSYDKKQTLYLLGASLIALLSERCTKRNSVVSECAKTKRRRAKEDLRRQGIEP